VRGVIVHMKASITVLAVAFASPVRADPPRALTKDDVRATVKRVVPLVEPCYVRAHASDPTIAGVVNPELTITSGGGRTTFRVRGFDTTGPLGKNAAFLACAKAALEGAVLPPLAVTGSIALTYPITFTTRAPDNHEASILDDARRALAGQRWADALATAERGLELTSIDGTIRRPLIEVAGIAACRLGRTAKVRHYLELSSPTHERAIRAACRL
jgi:hypothetical protein